MRRFNTLLFVGTVAGLALLAVAAKKNRQKTVGSKKDPVLRWENEGGSVPELAAHQQDNANIAAVAR